MLRDCQTRCAWMLRAAKPQCWALLCLLCSLATSRVAKLWLERFRFRAQQDPNIWRLPHSIEFTPNTLCFPSTLGISLPCWCLCHTKKRRTHPTVAHAGTEIDADGAPPDSAGLWLPLCSQHVHVCESGACLLSLYAPNQSCGAWRWPKISKCK